MPDWSQILCCPRRRSPKHPSAVSSPGLHALSSRLGSSEEDVDAATSTSRLLVPENSKQHLTRRHPLNSAPAEYGGQPSSASRPVTPIGAVSSRPVSILSSHESVVQPGIQLTPPSTDTRSAQAQQYLAPPPSQQSFHAESIIPPAGRDSPQPRHQKGMFGDAHNFSMTGSTFVDVAVTNINTISSQFMEKLLKETIPGAASDSSARYPPPQCHPGTRLAVLERCLHFITNCEGEQKIRWVVGSAGVGKSAIMQSVADSPDLRVTFYVSIFFSINGRNDGTKAIITLCYQLAAKSELYRQFIEHEVARDPSLLQSSMPVQFKKFIIDPFVHKSQLLNSPERALIIIDGLDECNNPRTQQELLRLISDFCIKYPSSPLVWLIASRPEQHITSFFARPNVMPAYEKEEIQVDSDESRADVERFLRERLEEIKGGSNSFDPHSKWPEKKDFWKLAKAAGGLFAYADTVTRYIDDSRVGNPVSQFADVLKVIDNHPMTGIPREEHPMALLDALYARILSNVPAKVIIHTRKLVLALASSWNHDLFGKGSFVELCNWLAITPDEAYAAVNQLQSLLRTPRRGQAHLKKLEPFHKSFIDYVSDSSRSNFLPPDMWHEAQQLRTECAYRVLDEAPDGVDSGDIDYKFFYGILRRGPGTGDKISLTWPVDSHDKGTRLILYKLAIGEFADEFMNGDPTFKSEFPIRLLITRFRMYDNIDHDALRELVFDESWRDEITRCGILKQMPLKAVPGTPFGYIKLRFRRPAGSVAPDMSTIPNTVKFRCPEARATTSLSDPWNSSCFHRRKGEWEGGKDQDWDTSVRDPWNICGFCHGRFERQLQSWKTHSPNHSVSFLFTSVGELGVEFRFVDPDDGISEWTYRFWVELSPEERKKYECTV